MVRSGRPIRNRVVDVFTPVWTFVGEANQLSEQGVRWQVVPNFVPDSLLSPASVPRDPALPSGDYLFFAGDLSDQKGVDTLLAAYARLDADTRPSSSWSDARRWTSSSLPPGARAEEKWAHDRVVSGFAHARAAVLPAKWPDPCPTTVLEAMALGAPLVTTHMGGIADMVTHEESALVVPPGDVAATAAALTRISTDPVLAGTAGRAGAGRGEALPAEPRRRRLRGDLRARWCDVGSEAAPAAYRAEDEQGERDDGKDDENGPQHGVVPSG